jgi:hypothetical protein
VMEKDRQDALRKR